MSSKFRHESAKRKYTVQTFLNRFMSIGLVSLLIITMIATLVAFNILINEEVEQAITLGYMKNLAIPAATMAGLKQNDVEMIGNDLSVSARFISDLVSKPEIYKNETYLKKTHIIDGVSLARLQTNKCEVKDNVYEFLFTGDII